MPKSVTAIALLLVIAALFTPSLSSAQGRGALGGADPGPVVTVQGKTYTQRSLYVRSHGTGNDEYTPFPPHKIIGNIYYVGTVSQAAFLVVTPQGNILINSGYERNVPIIRKSIEQLGFKYSDTKIVLASHAHPDHQEGDAMVKALTGAQVIVMAEDVPALQKMTPGGKPHPVDRAIHDGDIVTLGGTTLVAHLTPGHTRGCTTWTLQAMENGRLHDAVIMCGINPDPGFALVNNPEAPRIAEEFPRTFEVIRTLNCDVPLGAHPALYGMAGKYARLKPGAPNPYVDPMGCKLEVEIAEAVFNAVLADERKAAATAAAR